MKGTSSHTIHSWIRYAANELNAADIPSSRLDAEIILAHTLKKPRTYLHAHADDPLVGRELEIANARLDLRKDRTPVAYIIGHKEFYGRKFHVSPSVLIPRPESEDGIDLLGELIPKNQPLFNETARLVDVGTGSGALGITAKLEHPELEVHLLDISRHALTIARRNASTLHADIEVIESDLLTNFPLAVDYIIANLPYVSKGWKDLSPELRHEPETALYADKDGLALILKLLPQATRILRPGGHLLIEADPEQHKDITTEAKAAGLRGVASKGYYLAFTPEPSA